MALLYPDKSRDWLKIQQRKMEKSSKLSDMATELKDLTEDLEETINQKANNRTR